ncbi:MAG: hypothetical protein JW864_01270 [Spirochaetes bacterium]|nr:hypothetical protein [Spirochaetota bacterium]
MNELIAYIHENPVIAVAGAALLMLLAGIMLRRAKLLAIIMIAAAAFIFYVFLNSGKMGKVKMDELKDKVKNKVMENI